MIKRIIKRTLAILVTLFIILLIYGTIKQYNYDSMVESEYPPTGDFSNIGSSKIHYKYSGEGKITFILIAGLGESMHTWSGFAEELNHRGRVFIYDRSGLGHSEEGILPRSVDNCANELNKVLETEKIEGPYILIGHSVGGFIARYYAKKYPEKVSGLFLIDPYQGDVANSAGTNYSLTYQLINWSFRNMSWSGIPFYLLPRPPHPTYKTSKAIKTFGLEAYSENLSLAQFSEYENTGNSIPLYLIKAEIKDSPLNEVQNKWSKEIFNKYDNVNNKYIVIESGHHIHLEKPETVLNAVDEFVQVILK